LLSLHLAPLFCGREHRLEKFFRPINSDYLCSLRFWCRILYLTLSVQELLIKDIGHVEYVSKQIDLLSEKAGCNDEAL